MQIKANLGHEHGAAITYHQLASIAQERRDFDRAEQWHLRSLRIKKELGNERGAATTYCQLARLAQERRDFSKAEHWYLKSLHIEEKLGNEQGAAVTYGHLAILAGLRQQYEAAGSWLLKRILAFVRRNDPIGAEKNASNFLVFYQQAAPLEQGRLRSLWKNAGLPWPEEESPLTRLPIRGGRRSARAGRQPEPDLAGRRRSGRRGAERQTTTHPLLRRRWVGRRERSS